MNLKIPTELKHILFKTKKENQEKFAQRFRINNGFLINCAEVAKKANEPYLMKHKIPFFSRLYVVKKQYFIEPD